MTIPAILFLVALILALIEEAGAKGRALTDWAVILLAIGLLWGWIR